MSYISRLRFFEATETFFVSEYFRYEAAPKALGALHGPDGNISFLLVFVGLVLNQ